MNFKELLENSAWERRRIQISSVKHFSKKVVKLGGIVHCQSNTKSFKHTFLYKLGCKAVILQNSDPTGSAWELEGNTCFIQIQNCQAST